MWAEIKAKNKKQFAIAKKEKNGELSILSTFFTQEDAEKQLEKDLKYLKNCGFFDDNYINSICVAFDNR